LGKNQIIVVLSGLLLVCVFYIFGNRVGGQQAAHDDHDGHDHAAAPAGPMQGGGGPTVEAANFPELLSTAQASITADSAAKQQKLLTTADKSPSAIAFKDLAEFWEAQKELNIAAYYYKKAALLENSEKSITFAGNLFLAIMAKTQKAEIKKWQALEAIECFEKVIALNPDNVSAKTALANCYTDGTGETMKGVLLLKEVTAADSLNVPANLILGKLSVKSGQFDKAINRMNIVLSQEPKNTEAMYFLAEAFKGQGNKEKAIETFEKCKSIVNNPEFSAEIDNYINSFK
jgi:tetratricopeptide (TPR) repeat protein